MLKNWLLYFWAFGPVSLYSLFLSSSLAFSFLSFSAAIFLLSSFFPGLVFFLSFLSPFPALGFLCLALSLFRPIWLSFPSFISCGSMEWTREQRRQERQLQKGSRTGPGSAFCNLLLLLMLSIYGQYHQPSTCYSRGYMLVNMSKKVEHITY